MDYIDLILFKEDLINVLPNQIIVICKIKPINFKQSYFNIYIQITRIDTNQEWTFQHPITDVENYWYIFTLLLFSDRVWIELKPRMGIQTFDFLLNLFITNDIILHKWYKFPEEYRNQINSSTESIFTNNPER